MTVDERIGRRITIGIAWLAVAAGARAAVFAYRNRFVALGPSGA